MITRKGKLIYYDNKIINMKHCVSIEKFPENTIIINLVDMKPLILREIDNCDTIFRILEKAMK